MDYHDISAGNARLAVIKLPAAGKKMGTVFFNPGDLLRPPSWSSTTNIQPSQVDLEALGSKPSQ